MKFSDWIWVVIFGASLSVLIMMGTEKTSAEFSTNRAEKMDQSFLIKNTFKNSSGLYWKTGYYKNQIWISPENSENDDVITHELSHRFYHTILTESERREWRRLYMSGRGDYFASVSGYGRSNAEEDFAEISTAFMNRPYFLLFASEYNSVLKKKLHFLEKVYLKKISLDKFFRPESMSGFDDDIFKK